MYETARPICSPSASITKTEKKTPSYPAQFFLLTSMAPPPFFSDFYSLAAKCHLVSVQRLIDPSLFLSLSLSLSLWITWCNLDGAGTGQGNFPPLLKQTEKEAYFFWSDSDVKKFPHPPAKPIFPKGE